MSGERNDGGPAFPKPLDPYPNAQGMESGSHGMSLRDWFAGQALAAMSADLKRNQEYGSAMEELAGKAFAIADAMLKVRAS